MDPRKLISVLEAQGNKVTAAYVNENAKDQETPEKAFQKSMTALKKADFVVAECTNSNAGQGFLIAAALNEKKPVLALFDQSRSNSAPAMLSGYAARNRSLAVRGYTKETLSSVINEFFAEVRKVLDTKFILIISPEIDSYLQWASDNRRMHKAQVVRRAVEQVMNDDKEYKKHVNALKRK